MDGHENAMPEAGSRPGGADIPARPGADGLDLRPYAQALADVIESCDTPLTIGVQGELGVGKTTLMNLLRGGEAGANGLLDPSRCRAVTLETWPHAQFGDDQVLAVDCLRALVRRTSQAIAGVGMADERVRQTVSDALDDLDTIRQRQRGDINDKRQADAGADHEDVCALLSRFRSAFRTLAEAWTGGDPARRLVVFVDDLDRVQPAEAVLMLETLRHFTDVTGCVFVVAIDYDVVQQGVAARQGPEAQRLGGKAFYDRHIQLPFVMPVAAYPIGPFILAQLRHNGYPFSDELDDDAEARAFYEDITLCTVGRNPRNIKRVMNTARLLERIRYRQAGQHLTRRDARVLYALTCMQIAWPELFTYFVSDPTVDTVTSLQNWDFLARLSPARRLFENTADPERVHAHVATFFDTLFSLLDDNDDGQIDTQELGPVLDLMSMVPWQVETVRERPRDWFVRRVRENNHDQDPLIETFLDNVFTRSVWYLGSECRYHRSGARFVTLTYEGRQIASLVTLRSRPFVFRLAAAPEKVKSGLKAYWRSRHEVRDDAITLARAAFGQEASMTGFGDTFVDFSKMTNMRSKEAIGLLDALFRIAIDDPLTAWEQPTSPKKKK